MAKQILVRKAKISDLGAIYALDVQLFTLERKLFDKTLKIEWTHGGMKKLLAENIRSADCCVLVALAEGEIIGFIRGRKLSMKLAHRTVKTRAEIIAIFVRQDLRSRKAGAKLIKGFLAWAKSKKIDAVIVNPYVGNARAIDFYRRNGLVDYTVRLEAKLRRG